MILILFEINNNKLHKETNFLNSTATVNVLTTNDVAVSCLFIIFEKRQFSYKCFFGGSLGGSVCVKKRDKVRLGREKLVNLLIVLFRAQFNRFTESICDWLDELFNVDTVIHFNILILLINDTLQQGLAQPRSQ